MEHGASSLPPVSRLNGRNHYKSTAHTNTCTECVFVCVVKLKKQFNFIAIQIDTEKKTETEAEPESKPISAWESPRNGSVKL